VSDQIVIYQSPDGTTGIEVHLEAETVWLTQDQMAELFGRERSVITKHLRNVFSEGELDKTAVRAKFAHTAPDGKKYQTQFYNLDAILSAGYRVNSKGGTQFRQWATNVLRDHLVQGFTVNQSRLAEKGISEMQQAVELLARTLDHQALITNIGKDVLSVIVGYARTWRLLLQYDEDTLLLPAGCQPARDVLEYDFTRQAIFELKQELKGRGDATDLFGSERGEPLLRFSETLSVQCLVNRSTVQEKKRQRIFSTLSSKTILSSTATSVSGASCLFFTIGRKRYRKSLARTH